MPPTNNTFDVIVIGSGLSGGWAAKEFTEKGLKTLVLERGREVTHLKDYPTTNMMPWEFPHRNEVPQDIKAANPVISKCYAFKEDAMHFFVKGNEHPYVQEKPFDWIRGYQTGGKSLMWARQTQRWSEFDFEGPARDGYAVDWPIRYKDIATWYDYVEKFIGVTGTKEGLEILPDGQFQPAFDMNCAEKEVKQRLEGKYPNMRIIPTRVANLSQPLDGRSACQHRNLCHRGCPFGAYFSTQSSTLPAAAKTGNLTIRTGAVVNKILYDEKTGKASGVEVIDRETLKTYVYTADIIFLNASTLATAYILLNSTSSRFPNGMGNDFDIVGRHLMDHHKGLSITADVEGYEDKYTFGRRPGGVYIPRFKNIHTQEKDFLRGYYYQGNGYRESNSGSDEIGAGLKAAMSEPGRWKLRLSYYGETLPYAENRMTLNTDIKDIFGRPGMSIDCSFKENEKAIFKDAGDTIQQMLNDIGLKNVKVSGKMSAPGNANHEMGTARMGHDEKTSVLNKWNQLHAVKNLFITDGSSMTSSNCINPSLTYMALTARAVDYALREMKKGNI